MLHHDELPIGLGLVRQLVDRAFPAYRALELRALASSGSSNALFRLGNDLLVRLPRQPGGSASIDKEARWLPMIGPLLPVAVPEVVAVGSPDLGYSEHWSVVRWLSGQVAPAPSPGVAPDPGAWPSRGLRAGWRLAAGQSGLAAWQRRRGRLARAPVRPARQLHG